MDTITLGTRGSDLALAQAAMAEEALRGSGFGGEIVRRVITTSGDRRLDIRLSDFAKEGVVTQGAFTKELEDALLAGEIDCAVHSMKDLPARLGEGFEVAAVLPRAPVEDVLVTRGGAADIADLPEGAVLATGSVRRARLAAWLRPDLRLIDIRGNVPTRLRKLAGGEAGDATLLARAGLERLGFYRAGAEEIEIDGAALSCRELAADEFLPAAAQGAVAIEALAGCPFAEVLARVGHPATAACVGAERAFLEGLGAGCDTPVGAHARLGETGEELELRAVVFDEADPGAPPREGGATGPAAAPRDLAASLLRQLGFATDDHA